jgi:salicylate hydroxylase
MAGLGAALALAKICHKVTVFEIDGNLNESGGGIQLSPNCTRIINDYGLTEELTPRAMHLDAIKFRRYATGEIISQTDLHPHMTQRYGHPYLLVRRSDLQKILFDGAILAGAVVKFSQPVRSIIDDGGGPSVIFSNGTVQEVDLVIGADGIRSKCRHSIIPDSIIDPIPTDTCAYRAVIDTASVYDNTQTRHLLDGTDSNAWLGPRRQLLAYPSRGGLDFNIVGIHVGEVADPNKSSEVVEDLTAMRRDFEDFEPTVGELL